jgi:protein-export membrane protein SecD
MKIKSVLLFIVLVFISSSCTRIAGFFERGGRKYTIEVKASVPEFQNAPDEAVKVLSARLDAAGIRNEVKGTTANRVEVIAHGKFDAERIRNFLLYQGKLELAKVMGDSFQTYPTFEAALQSIGGELPPNRRVLPYSEREDTNVKDQKPQRWVIVENPPVIDGRAIRDASAYSQTGSDSDYQISFKLNKDGAEKFGDWTGKNIGKYLAIVLNDEVKSAPVIRGQIFDSGQIEGKFTKASAEDLALILKSGYLPATLTLIDESTFE